LYGLGSNTTLLAGESYVLIRRILARKVFVPSPASFAAADFGGSYGIQITKRKG
jgi:hypothetical protein